jgi:hypothetical protein
MRIIWTLFKVILGLAIAIPVGILALALMAGVLGTLVGLAILTLKLACLGLVGYGLFRIARSSSLLRRRSRPRQPCAACRRPIRTTKRRCEISTPSSEAGLASCFAVKRDQFPSVLIALCACTFR